MIGNDSDARRIAVSKGAVRDVYAIRLWAGLSPGLVVNPVANKPKGERDGRP